MSVVFPFFRVCTGTYAILVWVFSLWCCVPEGSFVLLCHPHPTILFISLTVMMNEGLSWIIHIFFTVVFTYHSLIDIHWSLFYLTVHLAVSLLRILCTWWENCALNFWKAEQTLNKALAILEEWCERNNMKINTSKTAFQSFSLAHKTIHPRLRYKGIALSQSNSSTLVWPSTTS